MVKVPPNATRINLSRNHINALPSSGVFSEFHQLQILTLDQNQVSFLHAGTFRGLSELKLLNLSCNCLSEIQSGTFQGLSRLKSLYMHRNSLSDIPSVFFLSLPRIKLLDLSRNKLESVGGNSVWNSSTLGWLDLSHNNISHLNLGSLPALSLLNLSHNPLGQMVPQTFAFNLYLKDLVLQGEMVQFLLGLAEEPPPILQSISFSYSVSLKDSTVCRLLQGLTKLKRLIVDLGGSGGLKNVSVLAACAKSKILQLNNAFLGSLENVPLLLPANGLIRLIMSNCNLQSISADTWKGLQILEVLHLDSNNELDIRNDTFIALQQLRSLKLDSSGIRKLHRDWFKNLGNLTTLSIIKNKLTELPGGVFSPLGNLKTLMLRQNVLRVIGKWDFCNLTQLQKLELDSNDIYHIDYGAFQGLKNLRWLGINGNRLKTVNPSIFQGLGRLTHLDMYNNRLHFGEQDVSPFEGLYSLVFLEFRYQGPGGDGLGTLGPSFFRGTENLHSLALGYMFMVTFHQDAFTPLSNLSLLYIASVSLTNVNLGRLFRNLTSLRKLTLYKTDLDSLPQDLLPPGSPLEYLNVRSNHFHVLEESLLGRLVHLSYLDVRDNPLSCTCQNAWFKNWSLNSPDMEAAYVYSLHCDNLPTSPYLWQFHDGDCVYNSLLFSLFLCTSLGDLLLMVLGLAWHMQWSYIRYLFLLVCSRVGGRRKVEGGGFLYDAFISYSSHDETWVMQELLPHLEGPGAGGRGEGGGGGFCLCLHHRNFRPGVAILENIEAAVYSSRRTLCVVSRDFLRSEWCSLEFQLASSRLLWERSDVLLLLFLEDIPDHCLSPYTRLRRLLRSNTYLLWPEREQDRAAFWVRLRDALHEGAGQGAEAGGFGGLMR
ncbi:TLR13 protein, partial [Amia calva]|nr:TLR13 protein [Amia calva]